MVLRALHLCSGYGGFELALRLAGIPARTVAHVERDAYAAATLVARMGEAHLDPAPVWSDLTTFDPGPFAGRVDLVTAGFPCQPFSTAGQRRGVDDDRWLWPAIWRLIRDLGPRFVFLENVPQLVRHGLPHVLADLAEGGFDAEWGLLSAAAVGAPHKRERIWLLADADGTGCQGRTGQGCHAPKPDPRREGVAESDGARRQRGGVRQHEPAQLGDEMADADRDGLPLVGGQSGDDWYARHHVDGCGGPAPERWFQWPPGRDDHDGWNRYLTAGGPQPSVRRSTDGRPPELADALHLGGNGLVPVVAAHALLALAERLGTGGD